MDIFNFQDLTGEFSVLDVVLAMLLSFLLSARNVSRIVRQREQ